MLTDETDSLGSGRNVQVAVVLFRVQVYRYSVVVAGGGGRFGRGGRVGRVVAGGRHG